jgi:hypothetical protein
MRDQESTRSRLDSKLRIISPILFLLAGVLFLVLPVAGSLCGDEEALVEVCAGGAQVLTGDPIVEAHRESAYDEAVMTEVFSRAAVLPGRLTALAVGLLLILVVGALMAMLVFDMRRRAVVSLAFAAAGATLLVVTDLLALNELHKSLELVRALYSGAIDVDPRTGHATMAVISWLTLIPLGAVLAVEAVAIRQARLD